MQYPTRRNQNRNPIYGPETGRFGSSVPGIERRRWLLLQEQAIARRDSLYRSARLRSNGCYREIEHCGGSLCARSGPLFEVGDPGCVVIVGGVCAEIAGDAREAQACDRVRPCFEAVRVMRSPRRELHRRSSEWGPATLRGIEFSRIGNRLC